MRIRILGSIPLTSGSGCSCRSVPKFSPTLRMKKVVTHFLMFELRKFKRLKIVKICLIINIYFSKNIFVLLLYFATIISVHSTLWWEKVKIQSRSVIVTNGSWCGSGWPKKIRILRIWIRIPNTVNVLSTGTGTCERTLAATAWATLLSLAAASPARFCRPPASVRPALPSLAVCGEMDGTGYPFSW
jgi:hypothetical protein